MDARATRRGIPAGVIWGGFGVLAWATITLFTGGSAAHADDDGPIDGLTGLISGTVAAITAPVTPVVNEVVAPVVTAVMTPVQQTVPAVVNTVTQTVTQVPVVGPVTAPLVTAVTDTVQTVVTPVVDVATDSPVTQITAPVIDLVTGLPIVGDLVDDLGVPVLVGDVAGVLDDTTALVGEVVDTTVPPVLEALEPETPGAPGEPAGPGTPIVFDPPPSLLVAAPASAVLSDAATPSSAPRALYATALAPAAGAPAPLGDPAAAPPGPPLTPSSSAASGGGPTAANARISDDGCTLLRAVGQDSGAPDDALPASPVADTDVSPD